MSMSVCKKWMGVKKFYSLKIWLFKLVQRGYQEENLRVLLGDNKTLISQPPDSSDY